MSTDLKVLRKARELIVTGWTQNAFAVDSKGLKIDEIDDLHAPKACAWSLTGAVIAAHMLVEFNHDGVDRIDGEIRKTLRSVLYPGSGWSDFSLMSDTLKFNDHPDRTQEQVLDVIDKTIIRLERSQMTTLTKLTKENLADNILAWGDAVHDLAISKGWWQTSVKEKDLIETLLLIKSEYLEAFEEYRKSDLDPTKSYTSDGGKPEGLPIEIADAAIRILDTMVAVARGYDTKIDPMVPGMVGLTFASAAPIADGMSRAIDDEVMLMGEFRRRYEKTLEEALKRKTLKEVVEKNAYVQLILDLALGMSRLMLFAEAKGFDLGDAIATKHAYNATRSFRHGNKRA